MKHEIVSHEAWLAARREFLVVEKEFTRQRDELSRRRRELPWERVEKEYAFDGPVGRQTLAQLFDGCSQLVVYHFMFPPEWDEGCKHCSFWADNFDPNRRSPRRCRCRRSLQCPGLHWRSSTGTGSGWDGASSGSRRSRRTSATTTARRSLPAEYDEAVFNFGTLTPGMSDREGVSVFFKDDAGAIFHTYSTYGRGIDMLNTAYNYLDLVPRGRDQDDRPNQWWVRRHDEYAR